ncbi:MAG: efflux RND transporter periplasmic adaptor subunit [Candidatus Sericytochromatia bacterium]
MVQLNKSLFKRTGRLWLGLILASALSCQSQNLPEKGLRLTAPRQGTFVRQVEMVGDVEAQTQVYLAPAFTAKLQKIAEDGAPVKKGQEVARLDVKDEEEDLEDQQLENDAAKSALQEHDNSTAGEKVRLGAEIQRAEAELAQKQLASQELEAGTRAEELEKKRLQLELTQKARELALSNLALKEKLASRGMSTQLEVLQAKQDLSNRERDFRVAEAEDQQAHAGATRLARQLARVEVELAQKSLVWARRSRDLSLKKLALERQKKKAKLESTALKVKRLQTRIRQSSLKAPMDGTVVINRTWTQEGLKRVGVGDEVFEGNPFMSVANLAQVRIRSELDETLIREIKVGLSALIELPSLKGKRFEGKITRIGVLAHEPSKRKNTQGLNKVFDLEILPEVQAGMFKPGTSVDIRLPLQERKQVLLLPREAIYRNSEGHYVLLASGEMRSVKLGEANPKEVVIRSGLSAEEQVRLPASEDTEADESADNAKNPAPKQGGGK